MTKGYIFSYKYYITYIFIAIICSSHSMARSRLILVYSRPSYRGKAFESEFQKKAPGSLVVVEFDDERTSITRHWPLITPRAGTFISQYCGLKNIIFYRIYQNENPRKVKSFVAYIDENGHLKQQTELESLRDVDMSNISISNDLNNLVYIKNGSSPIDGSAMLSQSCVCIFNLKTRQSKELAPKGYVYCRPVFSPDDQQIAFYRAPLKIADTFNSGMIGYGNDGCGYVPCIIHAGGGEVKVLTLPSDTLNLTMGEPPSWSPDGTRLLFTAQHNIPCIELPKVMNICSYDVDLKTLRTDRIAPPQSYHASWSPDGRKVVCTINGVATIIDMVTQAMQPLGFKGVGVWDPNGEYIASLAAIESESLLWIISANGQKAWKTDIEITNEIGIFWLK